MKTLPPDKQEEHTPFILIVKRRVKKRSDIYFSREATETKPYSIEHLAGWLFRVARNRIIDLLRKKRLGLLLLCRILFGGLGRHSYYGRSRFRRRMEERYGHTTPEERERFRQRMRERFDCGPSTAENKGQ